MNTITTTLLREIEGAALDFWIEHNHLVATGRKVGGEIWLDCDDVEEEEHICSNPSCEVQLDESYYQECQNERYIGEVCPVIVAVVVMNLTILKTKMYAVLVAVKEFAVSRKNHHTKIEKMKRYVMIAG